MTFPITIRSPRSDAEVDVYFRLCVRTFWPEAEPESKLDWLRRFVTEVPGFKLADLRCAFQGHQLVGGCVVYPRTLLVTPARLTTSCIALVATDAAYRGRGVARTLLDSVVAVAREQGHALLLLAGIPNFYHQFGFADILESSEHAIDRQYILAQPPSPCVVRPATPEDAPALLKLYRRHHEGYAGCFTRTLDEQLYRLRFRAADNRVYLSLTDVGEPCGYLIRDGVGSATAGEAVADSWPAALAMLQFQAQYVDIKDGQPDTIVWTAPPDSPTLFHLLDNMRFPRTTPLPPYPNWYVVRTQTRHLPLAGWMARPADLAVLVNALLPRWSHRLQHSPRHLPGALALTVDEQTFVLALRDGKLQLADQSREVAGSVRLTQELFTQLLFGFRPVRWVATRQGATISEELTPLLESLFPPGGGWIAASDAF